MTQLQRLFIGSEQLAGGQVWLTSSQQHYLKRVLRLQSGDRFIAMNGQGQWWLAMLTNQLSQAILLESIAAQTELPLALTLLIAMPKSGLEDVVRQVTELGVTEIVLISSQRTVLKPSAQKIDRWQRIAQEASEQSERQVVPNIHSPQSWVEALQHWNSDNCTSYVCEARGNHPHLLTKLVTPQTALPPTQQQFPIALAIGPEGGWTEPEIEQAIDAGYQPVSLGPRILRAVTAPVVAVALVASALETPSEFRV
jgi:16S rRNA (uracil1498-N3)-methyltransferase